MGGEDNNTELSRKLNKLPFSTDKVIGMGMRHFLSTMDPRDVTFSAHPNGFKIEVKCGAEAVKSAKSFWEERIEQRIGGEE